jgi:hypothetical protein
MREKIAEKNGKIAIKFKIERLIILLHFFTLLDMPSNVIREE